MRSVVAITGNRFRQLLPYVPALGDQGAVLFHATLRDGSTAIVEARDGVATFHRASVPLVSHPVAWRGGVLAYGADGRVWTGRERLAPLQMPGEVGPLGPTVAGDTVAVRLTVDGVAAVARVGGEVFRFPGEEVTGLPIATPDGAVWARTVSGARWRIWRDGVCVHEDGVPSGAFLAPRGASVLLPVGRSARQWPEDEPVPTPFAPRGVAWAGRLVSFRTEPVPQLQIGDRIVHEGWFALNAASVGAGRVVATVPTDDGREAVLCWTLDLNDPVAHAPPTEVP